ncbi:MAG: hypothetical protein JRE23_17555, partial [Deltaproteobacteria bacterium]|nr:hypothetical protein [Deltaproteobacteria bacterium]
MIDINKFQPALIPPLILLVLMSCQSVQRGFKSEAVPAELMESESQSERFVIEYLSSGIGITEPEDRILPVPVIHEAFDVYTFRQSEG